ncbi:DUF805 domain-containing protein [Pseudanabaena yagii]|uniref:DUF805 domain-containing protein n=1 Tax=Pseudanabaena yagii GIHE-NHR1 TaxID=2722753 RepID=A0ABX1LSV3_9CYAN|nr:DUF805 domain-containing protein [Pseudanabaena yagii]NMF58125.1 DUF805 domain-containing protein [Pseudanabaena yagii GIHE-NHR1]
MEWYLLALKKYAEFNGRAKRNEYWYFVLFNFLIALVLGFIDGLLHLTVAGGLGVLGSLYSLAVLVPGIAAGIRRLHDTGRSGWWLLIGFIPFVGVIILIVFLASESQPEPNQYDA